MGRCRGLGSGMSYVWSVGFMRCMFLLYGSWMCLAFLLVTCHVHVIMSLVDLLRCMYSNNWRILCFQCSCLLSFSLFVLCWAKYRREKDPPTSFLALCSTVDVYDSEHPTYEDYIRERAKKKKKKKKRKGRRRKACYVLFHRRNWRFKQWMAEE